MTETSGSLRKASSARSRALGVWSPRIERGADAAVGEGLLGEVHDVDVLGEEDHLADAARQLRGVLRGERRLGAPHASDHREDVLGAVARGVLQLPLRDPAHQRGVDAGLVEARAGRPGGQRAVVAGHQTARELPLGLPDRPRGLVVELDGEVGDAAFGDVGGHVALAPAHDALLDHGPTRGVGEGGVDRCQPGLLKRRHEGAARTGLLDPAEELSSSRLVRIAGGVTVIVLVEQVAFDRPASRLIGGQSADEFDAFVRSADHFLGESSPDAMRVPVP